MMTGYVVVKLGNVLVGTLSKQDDEFVFQYDPSFIATPNAQPIFGFPDLTKQYRSRYLGIFFAIRIPPANRPDVNNALTRLGVRPEQTLETLGLFAKPSISNPYRLEFCLKDET